MLLPGGLPGTTFCRGAPHSCSGGASWFSILDPNGHVLRTALGCGMSECEVCQTYGCTADCPMSVPLKASGEESSWSGAVYGANEQCNENGVYCAPRTCAEPGNYIARFCGYALTAGDGGLLDCEQHAATKPTCVDVPFEYPVAGPVTGVLDPRK